MTIIQIRKVPSIDIPLFNHIFINAPPFFSTQNKNYNFVFNSENTTFAEYSDLHFLLFQGKKKQETSLILRTSSAGKKQRCESLYYQSPFFMISRFRQNFPFLYPQTKQININLFAHGARKVINKHNLALIEFYRKAIKHNNNSTFSPVFPQGNIGERPKERQFLRRGVERSFILLMLVFLTPLFSILSPYLICDEQRERIESITLNRFIPSELYGVFSSSPTVSRSITGCGNRRGVK